jgi:hypothetical protein
MATELTNGDNSEIKNGRKSPAKSIIHKQNPSEIPESVGSTRDDGRVRGRFSTDLDSCDKSKSQNYADGHDISNRVWSPNYSNIAVKDNLSSASMGDFERKNSNGQNFST